MSYDITMLKDAGIDTGVGSEYTGGGDKYISALQRFYKGYEVNKSKVEDFYEKEDWANYNIIVHALKSNSKMIGAMSLSSSFEKLEMAASSGDEGTIKSNHKSTLDAWAEIIKALLPIGEMDRVKAKDEISADVARDVADRLLEALDDFDDELSLELAQKLSGYPFRITQRDKLKEATAYIEDFMYDEAADIIRQIAPAIE